MKKFLGICVLLLGFGLVMPVSASDAQFQADSAVADILFEYDGAETFATYAVAEDGFVDITFASNIPDELYSEILSRLQEHRAITGVLAGTSGPACSLF
jgi:hypothetical protein